ncbi:MAG: hypothetical protein ABIJ72_03615, partial [bacterium]
MDLLMKFLGFLIVALPIAIWCGIGFDKWSRDCASGQRSVVHPVHPYILAGPLMYVNWRPVV